MQNPPSILVVEDDQAMREILVDTFEDEDYSVQAAESVHEALSLASSSHDNRAIREWNA